MTLTFGSLFAGIGGFDLGLERAGMVCKWQVEIDDYCTRVLEKHWPEVKRYRDVREIHGVMAHAERKRGQGRKLYFRDKPETLRRRPSNTFSTSNQNRFEKICPSCLAPVDVVCGGFPCQPHSHAGKRRGAEDDRDLWPEFKRIIDELRPRWVVAENVLGIQTTILDTVLSDLEGMGYAWETAIIPACAVDAPHRRDRVWIVAHDERQGLALGQSQPGNNGTQQQTIERGGSQYVADSKCIRLERTELFQQWNDQRPRISNQSRWLPEPGVGRVAHGVPHRVDRLRALGNAVVPQVVEFIGSLIVEVER